MTLTATENKLVDNVKLYLTNADKRLSNEGIKLLAKTTQLKAILLHIAKVAPEPLEDILVNVSSILAADGKRRESDKKKRVLEAKEEEHRNPPAAKRQKLVIPAAEATVTASNSKAAGKLPMDGSRKPPAGSDGLDKEATEVREVRSGNDIARTSSPRSSIQDSPKVSSNGDTIESRSLTAPEIVAFTNPTKNHHNAPAAQLSRKDSSALPQSLGTGSLVSSNIVLQADSASMQPLQELCIASKTPSSQCSSSTSLSTSPSTPSPSRSTRLSTSETDLDGPTIDNQTPPTCLSDTEALVDRNQPTITASDVTTSQLSKPLGPPVSTSTSDVAHPANVLLQVIVPAPLAKVYIEKAITSFNEGMLDHLTETFKTKILPKRKRNRKMSPEKVDDSISAILGLCGNLNFDLIQEELLEFAELKLRTPSGRAPVTELPEDAEPIAIFNAIEVSAAHELDAKLHRVYGKMRLVKAIDEKVKKGCAPEGSEEAPEVDQCQLPGFYLGELADALCEGRPRSKRDQKREKLYREHLAGRKWEKLVKYLGGAGAIFIFVFADISCHALTCTFNEFQRDCIRYVMKRLPCINRLIQILGDNALESFCQQGQLPADVVERLRECEGPQVPPVQDEDQNDMASGEEHENRSAIIIEDDSEGSKSYSSDDESD
ncbi:MAG: hypothetical protein Q9209_005891 [Squamulea sp. 1 TL-2023]